MAIERTYTIVEGDTLGNIAQATLGDRWKYEEIKALNKLTSDTIHPGQILKIPGRTVQQQSIGGG